MAVWYAIRKNVSAFFIWDNNNTKTTFDWIDSEQYFNLHKIDWFPFSPDISMRKFSVFFFIENRWALFFFYCYFPHKDRYFMSNFRYFYWPIRYIQMMKLENWSALLSDMKLVHAFIPFTSFYGIFDILFLWLFNPLYFNLLAFTLILATSDIKTQHSWNVPNFTVK